MNVRVSTKHLIFQNRGALRIREPRTPYTVIRGDVCLDSGRRPPCRARLDGSGQPLCLAWGLRSGTCSVPWVNAAAGFGSRLGESKWTQRSTLVVVWRVDLYSLHRQEINIQSVCLNDQPVGGRVCRFCSGLLVLLPALHAACSKMLLSEKIGVWFPTISALAPLSDTEV